MISLMQIWMQAGALLSNKEPNGLLAMFRVGNAKVQGRHRGMQGYRVYWSIGYASGSESALFNAKCVLFLILVSCKEK